VQDERTGNAATGEILCNLIIDPTRDYHGTGRPLGPPPKRNEPEPTSVGSGFADVLRHHTVGPVGRTHNLRRQIWPIIGGPRRSRLPRSERLLCEVDRVIAPFGQQPAC
jgi:hypothetical protein